MLAQETILEECLKKLLGNIISMGKDASPLKDPKFISALRDAYNTLSTAEIDPQQFGMIIADLPKRLKFYNQIFITLQTKRKSGAFLDDYFGTSDIHSFIEFMDSEINGLIQILGLQPDIQSELIENGSIKILVEMFCLKSISDALKLKILSFFRLLNWNPEPEQLREKLLYIIEDNVNTQFIEECLLLLLDKNIIEPKLAPTNFFQIITKNIDLASEIKHSCYRESSNILYKSIDFFYGHNQLVDLITIFLNVIDSNKDSDWQQKEIAMYGLFKISCDYLPDKLDSLVKKTVIERLKNGLSFFYVNEYKICQLIGSGGRPVHLITVLEKFINTVSISQSDKDKIFKDIIFNCKNEHLIQTILLSDELSNYLIKDVELDTYFRELLQDKLTLEETKVVINEYFGLTTENDYNDPKQEDCTNKLKEYKASDIEENLALLVNISCLSKQQYQHSGHLAAVKTLNYICDKPMDYLSHSNFSAQLSTIAITEFNFTIAIDLIRFIIVTAKCLTNENELNNIVKLALELTIRLPNTFLQQKTFDYIDYINRRFSLVPESMLKDYYLKLLPPLDLLKSEMIEGTRSSDLLLRGRQAEETKDFDLALRYYHKAENLDYNYRFYASIARALIYLRKAMPYTALEVLFDLSSDTYFFDLELNELIYNLTCQLGHIHDAVDIFNKINKVLPFYQKNILSFQAEIQLPKKHPLSAKFNEFYQKIETTILSDVTRDETIALGYSIQDHLTKLPISRDTLDFCFTIFSPIENIKSSNYPNEWRRILLNYLNFVFQEVASIDYHWQTAETVHFGQTENKLKQHIAESEIHEVYSRVFSEACSVEQILNFLTTENVDALTVTEFVRRYGHDSRIRNGYALGYSEDIAQTYDIYCFLFGLIRWEAAYHKHGISYVNNAKTPEFLDTISKTNKPIVFFLPTGLSRSNSDDDLGVTYRECQWVLENIRGGNKNIKNVILVFDAYNYLPYHLLTEIKYFHKYGTVFQFNKIENRNFNKKVEIATTAARHFLTYVVDVDKIKSTQQR